MFFAINENTWTFFSARFELEISVCDQAVTHQKGSLRDYSLSLMPVFLRTWSFSVIERCHSNDVGKCAGSWFACPEMIVANAVSEIRVRSPIVQFCKQGLRLVYMRGMKEEYFFLPPRVIPAVQESPRAHREWKDPNWAFCCNVRNKTNCIIDI